MDSFQRNQSLAISLVIDKTHHGFDLHNAGLGAVHKVGPRRAILTNFYLNNLFLSATFCHKSWNPLISPKHVTLSSQKP